MIEYMETNTEHPFKLPVVLYPCSNSHEAPLSVVLIKSKHLSKNRAKFEHLKTWCWKKKPASVKGLS